MRTKFPLFREIFQVGTRKKNFITISRLNKENNELFSSHHTARVYISLKGTEGKSFPRCLCDPRGGSFGRGETNTFLLSFPYGFGELLEVEVWHDNAGSSPGWLLVQVRYVYNGLSQ